MLRPCLRLQHINIEPCERTHTQNVCSWSHIQLCLCLQEPWHTHTPTSQHTQTQWQAIPQGLVPWEPLCLPSSLCVTLCFCVCACVFVLRTLQTETECLDFSKVITNRLLSPWPLGLHGLSPARLQTRTVSLSQHTYYTTNILYSNLENGCHNFTLSISFRTSIL